MDKSHDPPPPAPPTAGADTAKWGTAQMGTPAAPTSHPQNQQAAIWGPHRSDDEHPYVILQPSPTTTTHRGSPMESILDSFDSWAKKAEKLAADVWTNLRAAPSMPEAAWGKLSLTAKAITGGGFEPLFRQTFGVNDLSEKLKKSFACYLSTSTGPVAGTLYLSNVRMAFCSDRPLSFKAPSGEEAWSYYKVVVPLGKVAAVNPVTMRESPSEEKYVQVVTVDGHEFWFMGFVSYDKAVMHLLDGVAEYAAAAAAAAGRTE